MVAKRRRELLSHLNPVHPIRVKHSLYRGRCTCVKAGVIAFLASSEPCSPPSRMESTALSAVMSAMSASRASWRHGAAPLGLETHVEQQRL